MHHWIWMFSFLCCLPCDPFVPKAPAPCGRQICRSSKSVNLGCCKLNVNPLKIGLNPFFLVTKIVKVLPQIWQNPYYVFLKKIPFPEKKIFQTWCDMNFWEVFLENSWRSLRRGIVLVQCYCGILIGPWIKEIQLGETSFQPSRPECQAETLRLLMVVKIPNQRIPFERMRMQTLKYNLTCIKYLWIGTGFESHQ